MTKSSLPKGWRLVKFGDIVDNMNEATRDPESMGLDRVVGLDHMDTESLPLKRWDNFSDLHEGTSFTRVFRSGQVLFGKRRAYQRKVSVPDFDGICSGDILVFQPKNEELLSEFLPFLVQSDGFFDHALGTSAGSLSPRTKWQELAKYEFVLPPIAEQHRIVPVLNEIAKVAKIYESVMPILRNLKISLWGEMVARVGRNSQAFNLGSLISLEYGKALKAVDRLDGDVPVYGSAGMVGTHNQCLATSSRNIVVGRKGSAGSVTVVESPCWVIDTAYFVTIKNRDLEFDFVKELLIQSKLSELNTQTAVPGLNREEVYRKKVVLPNSATRSEYRAKFDQINSLMATLRRHLEEAKSIQFALREHILLASQNV